ncbi:MAG: SDR family oxidoreductase [Flavobacteriales bacterium]|jgi:3-oxoacyl-[acyl-carrier protein] reductase|nr:SDR family oxidoreductase [Flavobacteriales bacterium]MBT5933615.1 SDR family oxidoreductase [Flavobacteriales bacterium]
MKKKILVVGGTKGIGESVVDLLSEYECVVFSRNESALENHLVCDVLKDDLPDIDNLSGLVYCPGSINLKPFHRLSEEDFLQDFQINVLGAVRVIQKYFRELKRNKGSIVLFGTVAAHQGMSFHASIAAAKGGLEALGRSLAAEWAPHIRVNIVNPSLTETSLADGLLNTDQKKENAALRHPLKKIGQPIDIAKAVQLCLENEWMTGQTIGVDGGMSTLK